MVTEIGAELLPIEQIDITTFFLSVFTLVVLVFIIAWVVYKINSTSGDKVTQWIGDLIEALFPEGNYHYYIAYLSALLFFAVATYSLIFMLGMLDNGITISTDTFVTHMDFRTSHWIKEPWFKIISILSDEAGIIYAILAIHTGLSIFFDIMRPFNKLCNRIYYRLRIGDWMKTLLKGD